VDRLVYANGGDGDRSADNSRKGGKHRKGHRKHHRKAGHHRKGKKHHGNGKKHLRSALRSSREIVKDAFVAPNNVGPKTIPNYDAVANQAITDLPSGGRVFAGQRDDPFFVDLGATFDAVNIDKPGRPGIGLGNNGGGKDDLAGYGVHSIVLQVPERNVTRDGEQISSDKDNNAVVGVWASTERKRVQVVGSRSNDDGNGSDWVQVSRLGNPLVNEVVVPLGKKDFFNSTSPADDAKNFGKYVLNPELARLMNALFNLGVKETDRTDIVLALLQGIPGLNQQTGKPVDTIKLNLGTDPTSNPKRLGVLAGDTAGFPNGRRLTDDVTDIELRVVAGALIGKDVPLGDGVDQNDKAFSDQFPYVAAPDSGFNATIKGFPPQAP
jgi:hypothetical protein